MTARRQRRTERWSDSPRPASSLPGPGGRPEPRPPAQAAPRGQGVTGPEAEEAEGGARASHALPRPGPNPDWASCS